MRSIPAGVKWLAAAGGVVLVAYSVVMSGKTSPGETRPTAPPTATEPRSMTPAASPLMQPRVNCRKRKCVALTFDGGPGRHTARLLRILDRHDARVTFFLIGRKIEDRADLVRRMAAGGHVVGNHTWSHPRLTDVPTAKVRRQLRRTEKAIEAQTGGRSRVMRPPQGATDERISRISRSIGLAQILWDVRALDWRDHDTSLIARRILGGTRRDSIILLHDIYVAPCPPYQESSRGWTSGATRSSPFPSCSGAQDSSPARSIAGVEHENRSTNPARVDQDVAVGDFAADTEIKGGDGRYTADLSADWEAWGPNGGYLAAILLRAAGASGGQPRPASMTCHFLAVADSDRVDLTARILRSSRRAQSIRTTMEQNGRPIAEAMVWLVSNGLDGVTHDVAIMPDVSGPEELRPIEELSDDSPDGVPPFWSNFEWRPTLWHPDWQAREPGAPPWHGWYRYGERPTEPEDPILAAARTLPLLDVMGWAAAYEAHPPDVPYIAPNLDLNVQFHRVISPSEWLFADATSRVAGEGLVGFSNTIWSEDRRLLASASGQLLCRPVR